MPTAKKIRPFEKAELTRKGIREFFGSLKNEERQEFLSLLTGFIDRLSKEQGLLLFEAFRLALDEESEDERLLRGFSGVVGVEELPEPPDFTGRPQLDALLDQFAAEPDDLGPRILRHAFRLLWCFWWGYRQGRYDEKPPVTSSEISGSR